MNDGQKWSEETMRTWLGEALGLCNGHAPFPWQLELLDRFSRGQLERSLDIPTGLGKTAVMAIWLVARATGAPLPRRLIYVVDRRAVVDQSTEVALALRDYVERNSAFKKALGLASRPLPISTLRGQHLDNREWLADPASPAIVVGTVDMIGSRLLFEGYGISRKMRPYHAGLLGSDSLIVLDEAHLVPPFEKLIETIAEGSAQFGPQREELRRLVPSCKLMSLSATGRTIAGRSFGLTEADLVPGGIPRKRLDASKRLTVLPALGEGTTLSEGLAAQAWKLAMASAQPVRCIVYCHKRDDATKVKAAIEAFAKGDKRQELPVVEIHEPQLLVGGRRVFERQGAAGWLKERGYLAGFDTERERHAFLIATSAGEVGVDLDADHMVSDLVAWERMVQRLGRVNRRGDGDARVVVLTEKPSNELIKAREKKPDKRGSKDRNVIAETDTKAAALELLVRLPVREGAGDASPGAIRKLKQDAESDETLRKMFESATTAAPLRPELGRALVDAWSMTSLLEHTGRPEVGPWLRGWIEEESVQTAVVWRTHLPSCNGVLVSESEVEAFFEAAPPHASEVLDLETFAVAKWLRARAGSLLAARKGEHDAHANDDGDQDGAKLRSLDTVAIVLSGAGELRKVLRLSDLRFDEAKDGGKRQAEELMRTLAGATLVVDARIGGLSDGLLDEKAVDLPRCADDGEPWRLGDEAQGDAPAIGFRVRKVARAEVLVADRNWRERCRFASKMSADGEATHWLVVEKWRHAASTEEDRSTSRPQLLVDHLAATEARARMLGQQIGLAGEYLEVLGAAARLHDAGKASSRWQRAFHAEATGVYAKTRGPVSPALLDGYRHEFGSLPVAASDARVRELPEELQELVLHLIGAHHGFSRPVIGTGGCDDAPPSALEARAEEAALRFARLQRRWGPWGLAWWEALVRAADQQASRDNDQGDRANEKEGA